jgi:predicted DNA-binding protein
MATQMIIRLDDKLISRMQELARTEGKNASQVVRELVEAYVSERDPTAAIEDLWDRIGDKLQKRGAQKRHINRAIRQVRSGK